MKKVMKTAVALAVLATPAMSANLENPLYLPGSGQGYSKTSAGVMYKTIDSTLVQSLKKHSGAEEWPVLRFAEDLGYGITDRLMVRGQVGWTQDDDINRKGMHLGRLGLNYRALDGSATDGWVLDVYGDAHLGGVSKMTGKINANQTFDYDNYTTGQYGAYAGFQVGKKLSDKLTGALFAEAGYYFASDNTEIDGMDLMKLAAFGAGYQASGLPAVGAAYAAGLNGMNPNIVATMGSSIDWNIGTKFSYDWTKKLTSLFSLTWKHHAAHTVESVTADTSGAANKAIADAVVSGLAAKFENKDLKDGFNEYALGATLAYALTDSTQVAVYGEYTFDDGEEMSQNSTDVKAEAGVRLNVQF